MVKDFFIHLCIVITFLFIGGIFFKSNSNMNTVRQKFILGLLAGVLGSILMFFSIQITPVIMMDLRHIAILLSAFYGGLTSALVSLIIILLSRIVFFEWSLGSILLTIFICIAIGISSSLIKRKISSSDFMKWTMMGTLSLVFITVGFLYSLGVSTYVYQLMLSYWIFTTIAGIIIFFLGQYIDQSNKLFNEMRVQSKIDFLTGLNNVRQFDMALNESFKNAKLKKENLSLLLIDIDHFKKVNDTFGHIAGDEILRQIGAILDNLSRKVDIVSRNGGEEFSILLIECSYTQAVEIAERIRSEIERHNFLLPNQKDIKVTVSIGVSTYQETTQCSEQLVKQADDRLYQAKRTGRNQVCSVYCEKIEREIG